MAGWVVLAILMSADSSAVQPTTFNHVRSHESQVREAITEGFARSQTFRALVEATERLSCVVYVATIVKLSQGMQGALLHQQAGRPEMPILRVLLKSNLSRDEAIATIGHELQHVVEAIEGGAAAGVEMAAVFDRLDTSGATGLRKYETHAAVEITDRIRNELRRHRR